MHVWPTFILLSSKHFSFVTSFIWLGIMLLLFIDAGLMLMLLIGCFWSDLWWWWLLLLILTVDIEFSRSIIISFWPLAVIECLVSLLLLLLRSTILTIVVVVVDLLLVDCDRANLFDSSLYFCANVDVDVADDDECLPVFLLLLL